MSCRHGWNREHLEKEFTKTFLDGTFKTCRENILFDRQISMLPATQQKAEAYKIRERFDKEIALKQTQVTEIKKQLSMQHLNLTEDADTALRVADTIHSFRLKWIVAKEEISHLQTKKDILAPNRHGGSVAVAEKRQFIKACPATNCRGFLSTAWKCGLCEIWVCPDCHEIKGKDRDAPHVCDKQTLETVKLLASDTRQCPKCPTMIFKIDGCDQMYCTQCHTAFSWRTGHVETGIVHNPHYYAYLRQQNGGVIPRNPGDVPCGENDRIITTNGLLQVLDRLSSPNAAPPRNAWHRYVPTAADEMELVGIHRNYMHIQEVELRHYVVNNNQDNEDLRIKYMVNEIEADKFKVLLQQREKKNEKKTEIHMVLTTYLAVAMDLINSVRTFTSKDQLPPLIEALSNIRTYTNKSMVPISKRYNCVVPKIEVNDVKTTKF
jgi:hypothetical protein